MPFAPDNNLLVLPRPGAAPSLSPHKPPIPGPAESHFTETFGQLLPPAKFLAIPDLGKAAFYELFSPPAQLPSSPNTPTSDATQSSVRRVLFLHGVQTPALGILPLARALLQDDQQLKPQNGHFVLLDLWGHGLSDTPVAAHTPALFHALIDALLDKLNWHENVYLVGYSFGGVVTTSYVASSSRRASRVSKITLVAPAGLISKEGFAEKEQRYLRGDEGLSNSDDNDREGTQDFQQAARKFIITDFLEGGELVVPSDWKEKVLQGEVVAEAVRSWQMHNHPGHASSVVAIVQDGGVLDSHDAFRCAAPGRSGIPALVVIGEKDDLTSEAELNNVGYANVVVVKGAGHGVVRQNVEEIKDAIGRFWNTSGVM